MRGLYDLRELPISLRTTHYKMYTGTVYLVHLTIYSTHYALYKIPSLYIKKNPFSKYNHFFSKKFDFVVGNYIVKEKYGSVLRRVADRAYLFMSGGRDGGCLFFVLRLSGYLV